MFKIGITGGIGCGKSTVLDVFAKLGVPCFEADAVAARYYDNPLFCQEVARLLDSPQVLTPQGLIDKRIVASIVFSNPDKLQQLNRLIHPRVLSDFEHFASSSSAPYVLFESAILFEYGFDSLMDRTVCVYLDVEERIRRLMIRDNTSRNQILARMHNQLPSEQLLQRADYVILNYEGNPRQRQVSMLHHALLSQASSFPNS